MARLKQHPIRTVVVAACVVFAILVVFAFAGTGSSSGPHTVRVHTR